MIPRRATALLLTALCLTAAAEAQQPAEVRVTAANRANIRVEPSTTARILTAVATGTVLIVVDRQGQWFQVRLPAGGTQIGFIHASTVEAVAPLPPPPPAPAPEPEAVPPPPVEPAVETAEPLNQVRAVSGRSRGLSFTIAGLRLVDDVPHTGGLAGVRIPVAGAVGLEPQIGLGVGDQHLAYLARAVLSLEHALSSGFALLLGVGYGLYGERSSGSSLTITRSATGPVGVAGIQVLLSDGLGLQFGMSVARVRYSGKGVGEGFSATVPHLMAGLSFGR